LHHWLCCNTKSIPEFSEPEHWPVLWQGIGTNHK
jgi:hypothetical protein